ncbi:MAG: selenocysteine-specific translation elongation factor [Eubacterium sp.]|nr:selenocysteine-specific translation elongation factor [Eubacterium sp.]
MKHVIIGTAGHIDHGKTFLTKALTGVDTDRLKEEQKRGITIENGYANLVLPNGQTASIIDVPGHEKFVKNMIAGATGIDAVMLIVAADEGVMPQTREHLDILRLLDIEVGVVVLTKKDLVEEDMLELVKEDVAEAVEGTFLEEAPMIAVSAYTGEGIDELKDSLVKLLQDAEEKNHDRFFRLPIDRVFTIQGHGTVVTGTSLDGTLKNDTEIEVYPQQKISRVRELQNHNAQTNKVTAGMRVAMNLPDFEKSELKRGDVVAEPGTVILTTKIDVKLTITKGCEYVIKNASQLHFYHGAREMTCKIRLLEGDEVKAGETTYAQLRFTEPLAARNQDRFIIRFFSPMITVGGGVILDVSARNHKRCHPETLAVFDKLASSDYAERLDQVIAERGITPTTAEDLIVRENESKAVVKQTIRKLLDAKSVVLIVNQYYAVRELETVWAEIEEILSAYHKENPLRSGMNIAELRSRIYKQQVPKKEVVLPYFEEQGKLRFEKESVALTTFEPTILEGYDDLMKEIEEYYKKADVRFPSNDEARAQKFAVKDAKAFERVFERMRKDGKLIALDQKYCVWHEAYDKALNTFKEMSKTQKEIKLAEFKDAMDFSRKFAQVYLEYWDRTQVTRRIGDAHALRQ